MDTILVIELTKLAKRHQIVSCGLRDFFEIVFPTLPPDRQLMVEKLRSQISEDLNATDNLDLKLAGLFEETP